MSAFNYLYAVHEVQVDKNDNLIAEFEDNLPHHSFIMDEMCKSWNDMHMEQYYDGILKNKILSAKMIPDIIDGTSCAKINIIGKSGVRFTQKVKDAIVEQTSAQMCDGWGEGFFGYANIMTAPDGTRLYVD